MKSKKFKKIEEKFKQAKLAKQQNVDAVCTHTRVFN